MLQVLLTIIEKLIDKLSKKNIMRHEGKEQLLQLFNRSGFTNAT